MGLKQFGLFLIAVVALCNAHAQAQDDISLGIIGVSRGEAEGITITRLTPGGPAERAGLQVGDIIIAINGKAVQRFSEEVELVSKRPEGSSDRVSYMRGAKKAEVVVVLGPTFGTAQQDGTLGSVKQKYLNQKVVLVGLVWDDPVRGPVLIEWNLGIEEAGRYKFDMHTNLPATYKGQTATVIAIQLNNGKKTPSVNALGEPIDPDNTVKPYFDFIVKLADGRVAMTSAYPDTIQEDVKLASDEDALAQEMTTKLPSLVGGTFYACEFTHLYSTDATLEEILEASRILKQLTDVPLLVPLKVTAAKYNESASAVILKLRLPDGRDALAVASGYPLTDKDETFLQRVSASLLSEIPKKLTPQEIRAIKKGSIFRGMSEDALYCSLGFPKSENDWGRGGKQLLYTDNLMVYLDNQDKVIDWQSLNN